MSIFERFMPEARAAKSQALKSQGCSEIHEVVVREVAKKAWTEGGAEVPDLNRVIARTGLERALGGMDCNFRISELGECALRVVCVSEICHRPALMPDVSIAATTVDVS